MNLTADKSFSIGWKLIFLAGAFPLFNGASLLLGYLAFFSGHQPQDWPLMLGWSAPETIPEENLPEERELGSFIWMITHVMAANLTNTGFIVCFSAYFWLRRYASKSAWVAMLVMLLLSGGNDAAALIYNAMQPDGGAFPLAVIPVALGALGLALTYQNVWKGSASPHVVEAK